MSRARLEKEEKRAVFRTALSGEGEEDVRPGVTTATTVATRTPEDSVSAGPTVIPTHPMSPALAQSSQAYMSEGLC